MTCPYCYSSKDIRRSHRRGWEWVLKPLCIVPYRCWDCSRRFYRFRFLACSKKIPNSKGASALELFRKAAIRGHDGAQFNLASMYYEGRDVLQDFKEALNWYRKAAVQGHSGAQLKLGYMYAAGQGVQRDYKEALHWFRKAAEQGYHGAQFNLALMYAEGRGTPRDNQEAMNWYRKAAEQGYDQAQYNLALMYAEGRGVARDYIQAHKWFNLAAAGFSTSDSVRDKAVRNLERVAGIMTEEQIAQAQRLALQWKPK